MTFAFLSFLFSFQVFSQQSFLQEGTANVKHDNVEGVGIDENLGENLNLDLTFTNEKGEEVKLAKYFNGDKPVLLTLIYFECPALCSFHLNGLTEVFKNVEDWTIGDQFEFIAVSINPREDHVMAAAKKRSYVKEYGKEDSIDGWHFLTGKEENIKALAEQIGFQYKWLEERQEYAHTAAAYVITPKGKISRYLYGIGFSPKTLRLSLVEASDGKVGDVLDRFILYCFQYDPNKKTYAFYAYNIMRAGAGLAGLILLAFLGSFWFRQRKNDLG